MDVNPPCPSEGRVTKGLCCWRNVVKVATRVGLLDRSESRVLGSAVFVGFVVVVVVNMEAGLMKGVVMLGGLAAEPAGGVYLNRFFCSTKKWTFCRPSSFLLSLTCGFPMAALASFCCNKSKIGRVGWKVAVLLRQMVLVLPPASLKRCGTASVAASVAMGSGDGQ